ncbi:MAG: non-heme iron oxygenase ferredoxin subunit [Anaerolineaceae bacterium]|jgi:3-phenylpropionate/trans-cinnamate dioxygenase ferredoxin subunit|nr:non-heme iron oxygenase ferredoxin subunit [Anaerolineaceae bacterium]
MSQEKFDAAKYEFVQITSVNEMEDGDRLFIELGEQTLILLAVDGGYYAVRDVCTHDDGPLGDGELEGWQLVCPRHGARFDIRTGEALTLPAVVDVPVFPVRVVGGMIEVGIPRDNA